MRRFGGLYIPLAPPVISKNIRAAADFLKPPTHEQAASAIAKPCILSLCETQNPPVLPGTESVCSGRQHPLSTPGGRQRYNTLDFTNKVVCHETAGFIGFFLPRQRCRLWEPLPTGRSSPLLETPSQRGCSPLNSPCVPVKCATN